MAGTRSTRKGERVPSAVNPVARVAVDVSLAHLDRPFDYLVTEGDSERARPGCRVRVRFAGQLVGGFILERLAETEHGGRLSFLERVVSDEPVLTHEVAGLARAVADRWAGSLADVLRLAIPPRHARVEAEQPKPNAEPPPAADGSALTRSALSRYAGGADLVGALGSDRPPRVVMPVLPGDWPDVAVEAVTSTLAAGRGVIVVVPDHRDVLRVDAALTKRLGAGGHVALRADLGPAERYRRFLSLLRGAVRCVVGTRSAVWAPVNDLGLVVVWDDGDDLLAEPRAPYCHSRDVAVLRAHRAKAGLLLAGHAVTAEAASLVGSEWATYAEPTADARQAALPTVRTADDDDAGDPLARAARLPSLAWKTAHDALAAGAPVLVQVPRGGYQPALACDRCRTPARCATCSGPLGRSRANSAPQCRWCGVVATGWSCQVCGGLAMRAVVIGAGRTAEELGRAFPGTAVRMSGGDDVVADVPHRPVLVVATPGAEPTAADGYGAALLLDGWVPLSRPELRSGEEAVRRWINAAALVRSADRGGRVVLVAPGDLRPVQTLLRWQPRWFAQRELDERAELHLPPAARMAALTGPADAVADLLEQTTLPAGAEVLGPVAVPGATGERMLVRVPRRAGAELAAALKAGAAVRSARKATDTVRIELDPQAPG